MLENLLEVVEGLVFQFGGSLFHHQAPRELVAAAFHFGFSALRDFLLNKSEYRNRLKTFMAEHGYHHAESRLHDTIGYEWVAA